MFAVLSLDIHYRAYAKLSQQGAAVLRKPDI